MIENCQSKNPDQLMRVMLKSVPEKFLRTLWYSHHGRVQSRKFYKLCFHRQEYYEKLSFDVQSGKKTKERKLIFPQNELVKKCVFGR